MAHVRIIEITNQSNENVCLYENDLSASEKNETTVT